MLNNDYINDFISSEHFIFISGTVKEYAESLLHHFATTCPTPLSITSFESTLNAMAALEIPYSAKQELPDLLAAFFTYLSSSGKYPEASAWEEYPSLVKTAYLSRFRDDGSFRGTTYTKKYTPTGRNEPCPCGSGRKFKKCCGR